MLSKKNFLLLSLLNFYAPASGYAEVGIKNFVQSWSYLASVSRISPSEQTRKYYSDAKTRLPKLGLLSEIGPISTLSWVTLSSLFCDDLIQNDIQVQDANSAQRVAHQSLTFNQPMDASTEAQLLDVFEKYAELFWGRNASDAEKKELLGLFRDLKTEALSSADWSSVLVGVCTAAISSIESFSH